MNEVTPGERRSLAGRLARRSTGLKLFLVLSVALLPLGIIALFASLQSTRNADLERRSLLRVALNDSARRLGAEIGTDITALRLAIDAEQRGAVDSQLCTRTRNILSAQKPLPIMFAVYTYSGASICRSPGFRPSLRPPQPSDAQLTTIIDTNQRQLRVRVQSADRRVVGIIVYSERLVGAIGRPGGPLPAYDLWLKQGADALTLSDDYRHGPLARSETLAVNVQPTGSVLEMSVQSVPFTASEILTMLLPILMWLAAVVTGWLVVDRLLLTPLNELRRTIARYKPGDVIDPPARMTIPAHEIRELGTTFRSITETVAAHESDLAEGLSRQRKLTREVHHRVKNNLQVVTSLISLHSRGAKSAEAASAYATIQRRVDALAVVHRNHFAELEENRGVNLRSLIGELTSNLRVTAPPEASHMSIALDLAPCFVTQDVAMPVAFLITELVELAMTCDPRAVIAIRMTCGDAPGHGELTVSSPALADGPAVQAKLAERFGRVIEGLARQLRSTLRREPETGLFCVAIPVV